MTKKQKKILTRIIISFVILVILLIIENFTGLFEGVHWAIRLILYLIPYIIIGYDILWKAVRNISHGHVFDENFLMAVATVAAFGIAEYSEALAVMVFYQTGELFQSYAVGKSRQSITEMMDIAPEYANLVKDGSIEEVDPDEVQIGDIIVVKAGEKVPLDGRVIEGESYIDTKALTGESVPRHIKTGDDIISGCVNQNGILKVEVTKEYDDSTVARILELVENASSQKARVEKFITRFAKYYTPVVTIGAVILASFPPLLLGANFNTWVHNACIFLIVSCPCALVISVPLGFFGGIGAASKIGVLVKGSNYLEAVAELGSVVFDKTGTLTKGEFKVSGIVCSEDSISENELLEIAAYGEAYSNHPIALSVMEAYGKDIVFDRLSDNEEISGKGTRVKIDGKLLLVGNKALMEEGGTKMEKSDENDTIVHISLDGNYLGYLVISDMIKESSAETVKRLKDKGIKRTVMLTGDHEAIAEKVAKEIGISDYYASLLPQDKVRLIGELIESEENGKKVAFVGDGINDAPVLMRADVGLAMGSLGSDAAIEAADIVIMDDNILKIPRVIEIGRKTMSIVKQNIVFALSVKALVLIMGAFGQATMWEAVFADVGVSVIAILNSMRALHQAGKSSSSGQK
ncbi:MAG: cadmium-translocating P-type ATPase [Lachnospiraceae bacterium]|nr:cadmium-translocating P-type ATPase [Lachnospiraceae bacterium]